MRCERATVCIEPVRMEASLVESGSRTYFNDRSYDSQHSDLRTTTTNKKNKTTYQKESIGKESVKKHYPPNPATSPLPGSQDLRRHQCSDDPHEFVSRVRHEIQQLGLVVDTQNIHGQLQTQNLKQDHRNGRRGGRSKKLRMEITPEARQHRRKKDIRDQRHDRDVHVRRVEVIPRRGEHGRVLLLGDLAVGPGGCRETRLLARPRLVSPWEKHEDDFVQDVGVGDVEVVFKRGDRDVAIELYKLTSLTQVHCYQKQDIRSVPYIPAQLPWQSCQPEIPSEPWARS